MNQVIVSKSISSSKYCEVESQLVGVWTMALFMADGGGVFFK